MTLRGVPESREEASPLTEAKDSRATLDVPTPQSPVAS